MQRAIKSGEIRKDLDPIDLLRALIGVSNVASSLTGSKARGDWLTFSSPVRGQWHTNTRRVTNSFERDGLDRILWARGCSSLY